MTNRQQERIASLCSEFHLPTVAAEVVARFQAAEHGKALGTLLELGLAFPKREATDGRPAERWFAQSPSATKATYATEGGADGGFGRFGRFCRTSTQAENAPAGDDGEWGDL